MVVVGKQSVQLHRHSFHNELPSTAVVEGGNIIPTIVPRGLVYRIAYSLNCIQKWLSLYYDVKEGNPQCHMTFSYLKVRENISQFETFLYYFGLYKRNWFSLGNWELPKIGVAGAATNVGMT